VILFNPHLEDLHGDFSVSGRNSVMTIRTRAAVVRRRGGPFLFEDVEIDDPRADEVLVRMVACGICHTDIAGRDGALGVPLPAVFGHEGAGVVERVGRKAGRVRTGDKVVLSFSSCGECPGCLGGHPARCEEFDALNFGGARPDGSSTIRDTEGAPLGSSFFGQSSLAGYAPVRARGLVRVEAVDEDELTILAALGCGIQAGAGTVLNELKPRRGESVAIFGAGTVGLAALMAARLAGAAPVVVVDVVASRLELALELGAAVAVDGRAGDVNERLRETAGSIDHAVETTGVSRVIDCAMKALGPRGNISLLAVSADEGAERVHPKSPDPGQSVIYSVAGDSDPQTFIPFLIRKHKEGAFPFDKLIRIYPASRIDEAVRHSLSGITVKPVLRF